MKKKFVLALAGVLIVAPAPALGGGPSAKTAQRRRQPARRKGAAPAPAPPPLVTLAAAQQQDVPVTVQVNGSVVSLNSVDLRPQVTNTVREVHVKEGQFVKAGPVAVHARRPRRPGQPRQGPRAAAEGRGHDGRPGAPVQAQPGAGGAELHRQGRRRRDAVAARGAARRGGGRSRGGAVGAGGAGLRHAARAHRRAHRRRQHLPGHAGAAQPVAGDHHPARPDRGELPGARRQAAGPAGRGALAHAGRGAGEPGARRR